MLKIPSWRRFAEHGVTAFQDDTIFWKFYLIPDNVTIRKDANGKPVFLLIAYAFGDQDREENPDLPRGGGFMVMDTELSVAPAALGPITTQLQTDVSQLWNELKDLAEAHSSDVRGYRIGSHHRLPGLDAGVGLGVDDVLLGLSPDAPQAPPGDAPPKVILGEPTWVEGTFRVSAPQSEHLISNRVAEGKLSLLGGNVAAANLDLTSAGADFMVQTLTNPDGTGATDLTPIQVTYDLKYLARVPPVSIDVQADSRSLYAGVQGIFHEYSGNGCDDDSISHSEQNLEMAVSSGLMTVRVDKGDADIPDDIMNQMRADAMKTVTEMMKDRFLDRKPAPEPPEDETKDFVERDSDIYFLKSEVSVDFSHFQYSEKLASVRKWPAAPQGTLQSFLFGLSPEEVKQYVRRVDLNDPFFQTLSLDVQVQGIAWDTDPIDFVEVSLHYEGTDENAQQQEKSTTAVFTKESEPFSWDPSLIGAKREYQYRYRVGYRGHAPSEWTDWEDETTNHLLVAVEAPGKVAVTFHPGNLDFASLVQQVQIELEYADPTQGVVKDGTTLALNGAEGEALYERWIFVPVKKPLRYRARYFLKNDQEIEGDWVETTLDAVYINEPRSDNRLDVQLFPTGKGWGEVVQTIVALRYSDPDHGVSVEGTHRLLTLDEFKTWSLFLENPARRTFQYKVLTSFKDGTSDETPWLDADGDDTLTISVRDLPSLEVNLRPMLIDFAVTPVVEVDLSYDDDTADIHEHETLALTSNDPLKWEVDLRPTSPREFTHTVTYNRADGQVVVRPSVRGADDEIAIPKLLVPEVSCLMVPKLVDFTTTPVIEVTIEYADPAHQIDSSETFIFTAAEDQQFKVGVAEGSPRDYLVNVTYYLGDGTIVPRDPVTLDQSKITIPRYVAAV